MTEAGNETTRDRRLEGLDRDSQAVGILLLDASETRIFDLAGVADLWRDRTRRWIGIQVEDENLHRLCALPVAREVSLTRLRAEPMTAGDLLGRLEQQQRRMQRALRAQLLNAQIELTLETRRGWVASEVSSLLSQPAHAAVMIVVGKRLNLTEATAIAEEFAGQSPILLINEPWRSGNCIAELAPSRTAPTPAIVQQIAEHQHLPIVRLVLEDIPERAAEPPHGAPPKTTPWVTRDSRGLTHAVRQIDPRILVLPLAVIKQRPQLLSQLYLETDASVLLVPNAS